MRKLKEIHLNKQLKDSYNTILNDTRRSKKTHTICRVLLLYDEYKNIDKVIKETGVSKRSIFYYRKKFNINPFFMIEDPKTTNVSLLKDYVEVISDDFKKTHIKTYKQAQKRIEEITGIKRSEPQIRNFLIKNNFKKNKNGNYNQPPLKKFIGSKIENTCLYQKREEVEKYIDELMPSSPNIMVRKLKEKYPELKIFIDEVIIEHTSSISPF